MKRYRGIRRQSLFQTFEFEAEDAASAMEKLSQDFMIGQPVSEVWGEEYRDLGVEELDNDDS